MSSYATIKISRDELSTVQRMVDGSNGKYNSVEEWVSSAIIEKFLKENGRS